MAVKNCSNSFAHSYPVDSYVSLKGGLQFYCNLLRLFAVVSVLTLYSGCRSTGWNSPEFAKPRQLAATSVDHTSVNLARVESAYANACSLESSENPSCVDQYFEASKLSWLELSKTLGRSEIKSGRLWEIYHSSVAKTVAMGQKYGRFDPLTGLEINSAQGKLRIPTRYHGFLWKPEDFNEFILVGKYNENYLSTTYRTDGLGVPLIVKRIRSFDEPLRKREQLFAATAIIKNSPNNSQAFTLEMFSPDKIEKIKLPLGNVAISRAPLAPFTYRMDTKGHLGFDAFRSLGSTANASGLYSVTPYQPGKIPLVFVHGLLSDPTTWGAMASGLLAQPEINAKYQIWIFEYQTGHAFVESARILRSDLAEARKTIDPNGLDPALDNIILVGHSMGGLVSKLQITSSENHMWDSIAKRPFNQLVAPKEVTAALSETYFFAPQPAIKRVVFIGTPHRGANSANQITGKIASALVNVPEEAMRYHRELISNNPEMFISQVQKKIPTSIDLLDPNNQTLQAVQRLPIAPYVAIHTILGDEKSMFSEPSDGVVPVTSAHLSKANSELTVQAEHTHLQVIPESIAEVSRILRLHARSSNLTVSPSYPTIPHGHNSSARIQSHSTIRVR